MDRSGELRLCSPCHDVFVFPVNLNMISEHSIASMRDQKVTVSL